MQQGEHCAAPQGGPPPPPPRPPLCGHQPGTGTVRAVAIRRNDPPMDYEPGTAPHVGTSTRVKVELGDLVKWGAALVAATVWAWTLWADVQRLKIETQEMRSEQKQMAEDVATIKRVVSLPGAFAVIQYPDPSQDQTPHK